MSIASFFPPSRRAALARTLLSAALAASGSLALAADYYIVVPNPAKAHVVEIPKDPIFVTLATATLPDAQVAKPYSASLSGFLSVAGDSTYTGSGVSWSLGTLGALPAGLTLGADGTISGTPTAASPGAGESFETLATYKGERGQQVYTIKVGALSGQVAYTTAGTFTWTVPAGVTSVSVVAVGGGNGAGSTATASGTSHFNSSLYAYGSSSTTGGGFAGADGGGKGGTGGLLNYRPQQCYQWNTTIWCDGPFYYGGGHGGGAGGYTSPGGAGAGGSTAAVPGFGGGGVGLQGGGAGGVGGTNAGGGAGGSGGADGAKAAPSVNAGGGQYGGGHGGFSGSGAANHGYGGGGLGYKNAIAVTPGQQIPVKVGIGGAVRIIWPGTMRQFPATRTADE